MSNIVVFIVVVHLFEVSGDSRFVNIVWIVGHGHHCLDFLFILMI